MKTRVRAHRRKGTRGVRRHSRKIGTSWKGEKYIHGPRRHSPSKYSVFKLGKPDKKGRRFVFGKIKGTNKWEIQSTLIPRNLGAWPFSQKKGYIALGSSYRILHWPSKKNVKFEDKPLNFEYPVQAERFIEKKLGGSKSFVIYKKSIKQKKSRGTL